MHLFEVKFYFNNIIFKNKGVYLFETFNLDGRIRFDDLGKQTHIICDIHV